jgi:hypothetical protein
MIDYWRNDGFPHLGSVVVRRYGQRYGAWTKIWMFAAGQGVLELDIPASDEQGEWPL